jgi:biotin transporter BioY
MKRKTIKYLIASFIFGCFNEIFFHPMWDYKDVLGPFLFADIPIIAPFGWAAISTLLLLLSDWVGKKAKLNQLFCDIVIFVAVFSPAEYILSRLGIWKYNYWLHENVAGMMIGYVITAYIISSCARRLYQKNNNQNLQAPV